MGAACGFQKAEPAVLLSNPPPISDVEYMAYEARRKIADEALRNFCAAYKIRIPEGAKMPVIGALFSGGGWRSLKSSCASLDALSEVGLVDALTYAAGLSGGSWCLSQYLIGEGNPFHGTPSKDNNPWVAGGKPFNALLDEYQYKGLIDMVSEKTVHFAATPDDNWASSLLRKLTQSIVTVASHDDVKDMTILFVMMNRHLGERIVERWSNFLERNLMSWRGPDRTPVDLGDDFIIQEQVSGRKPITILSVIANSVIADQRKHDWAEFTSFGVRRYPPNSLPLPGFTIQTKDLLGNIKKDSILQPIRQSTVDLLSTDPLVRRKSLASSGFAPLHLHHMMAICGSAFAFDWANSPFASLALPGDDDMVENPDPIIHGTTTRVPGIGELRDAGIDFNIPFPALLPQHSGRKCDIAFVFDASWDCKGCEEVEKAEKQGYITIDPADKNGWLDFGNQKARLLHPVDKSRSPTFVYTCGLRNRDTSQIISPATDVLEDVYTARCDVLRETIPLFCKALNEYFGNTDAPSVPAVSPSENPLVRNANLAVSGAFGTANATEEVGVLSDLSMCAARWIPALLGGIQKHSIANPYQAVQFLEVNAWKGDETSRQERKAIDEYLRNAMERVHLDDPVEPFTFQRDNDKAAARAIDCKVVSTNFLVNMAEERGSGTVTARFTGMIFVHYFAASKVIGPLRDLHVKITREKQPFTEADQKAIGALLDEMPEMSKKYRYMWSFLAYAAVEMDKRILSAINEKFFAMFSRHFAEGAPKVQALLSSEDAAEKLRMFSYREAIRSALGIDIGLEFLGILSQDGMGPSSPTSRFDFLLHSIANHSELLDQALPNIVAESAARFGNYVLVQECTKRSADPKVVAYDALIAVLGSPQKDNRMHVEDVKQVLEQLSGVTAPLTLADVCIQGNYRTAAEFLRNPAWDNNRQAVDAVIAHAKDTVAAKRLINLMLRDSDSTKEFIAYIKSALDAAGRKDLLIMEERKL